MLKRQEKCLARRCIEIEGIDVKTVSSIMGLANAAMTLNIYASADADAKRAAAMTIDEVMGRRLAPQELRSFA